MKFIVPRIKKRIFFSLLTILIQSRFADAKSAEGARETAPLDITGQWVSVVTQDWKYRMVSPANGQPNFVLNEDGMKLAEAWTKEKKFEKEKGLCKEFGPPGVMRMPGRLRIQWHDGNNLKLDLEAGGQTRQVHFLPVPPPADVVSRQGYSIGTWECANPVRGKCGKSQSKPDGVLKVVTTNMEPGYVRGGEPFSRGAKLTEYFNRVDSANGDAWLILVSVLDDPTYWWEPLVRSTHFKKIASSQKWKSIPCDQPKN